MSQALGKKVKKNEQKRRDAMKSMMKTAMGLSVLLTLAGCDNRGQRDDEFSNEIVASHSMWRNKESRVYYFEKKDPKSPEVRDVFLLRASHLLQIYRIENRTVTQCYFLTNDDSALDIIGQECFSVFNALLRLPNILKPDRAVSFNSEERHPVTIVNTRSGFREIDLDMLNQKDFVEWNGLWAWKWTGTSNETPAEFDMFHQMALQSFSSPEYARDYPSYVRAIPLFTEAELEAEKDTPIIDLSEPLKDAKRGHYHVVYAIGFSYALIPVPENRSPFPAVRKYTPGDKFKAENLGRWYLIETFKGSEKL